ncbi:MAG: glycosyltransferase family 39 protein [Elusimicrobia bacterium]|nr:glycosyltransferase family 39 protein [Candidatus Liberimonas magnetica]
MEKKQIIFIFLFSLTIYLLYTGLFCGFKWFMFGDATEYERYAVNLLSGKGYVYDIGGIESYARRPPLYPFLLAFIYYVFGHSFVVVKIVQAVLASVTNVITYSILLKFTGNKATAFISGLFSSIYFAYIYGVYMHLADGLFTFLLVLSVYLLIISNEDKMPGYLLSGIVLGLATLTRPTTLILPVILLPWFIFKYKNKAVKIFSAYLVGFVCLIAPWTIRNYLVYNAFIPVQTRSGENFWASNNPWSKGRCNQQHNDIENIKDLSELEKDKRMTKWAVDYLKGLSTVQFCKLYFLKAASFVYPFMCEYSFKYDPTFGMIIPFWFYGMYLTIKSKDLQGWLFLLILLTFFMFTLIYYGGEIRFRMAYSPYIIMLSSIGIANFTRVLGNMRVSAAVYLLWLVINIWAFFYYQYLYMIANYFLVAIRGS